MKIDIKNMDAFKQNKKFKVQRRSKVGSLLFCLIMGLYYSKAYYDTPDVPENIQTSVVSEANNKIYYCADYVNDYNIIINDSNCSDKFINEVTDLLTGMDLKFTLVHDDKNINVNDSIVISLDQQYSSGTKTIILAPFDNNSNTNSDALALAAQVSFKENGFHSCEIQCGKTGYQVNSNGEVIERIPSETEHKLANNTNTSYVTICFGTNKLDPQNVARAILNTLGRYDNYNDTENMGIDLIYRPENNDTIESISNMFNVSSNELRRVNPYEDKHLLNGVAIINPDFTKLTSFDKNTNIEFLKFRKIEK